MHKHTHRIAEKTAENRFLQNQAVDADESPAHHAREDYAPPALAPAEASDAEASDEERTQQDH